jgi:hypothetical protein
MYNYSALAWQTSHINYSPSKFERVNYIPYLTLLIYHCIIFISHRKAKKVPNLIECGWITINATFGLALIFHLLTQLLCVRSMQSWADICKWQCYPCYIWFATLLTMNTDDDSHSQSMGQNTLSMIIIGFESCLILSMNSSWLLTFVFQLSSIQSHL